MSERVATTRAWLMERALNELSGLADAEMEQVFASSGRHKTHPIARLLYGHAEVVTFNTDIAMRRLRRVGHDAWLKEKLALALGTDDLANSAAALGEIRALGAILASRPRTLPLKPGPKPTPEFRVQTSTGDVIVEVTTKQMNASEAERLAEFRGGPNGPGRRVVERDGHTMREHVTYPFGRPKDDKKGVQETVGENVAQKFAQLKPGARQASMAEPSVLWVDCQDEDCWVLNEDALQPITFFNGTCYSVGVWHGLYGIKSTPVFEEHRPQDGMQFPVRQMGFPGFFAQAPAWAGVIISLPRLIAAFENPAPTTPPPPYLWDWVFDLPGFSLEHSWIDYPQGVTPIVTRLHGEQSRLHALAAHAVREV